MSNVTLETLVFEYAISLGLGLSALGLLCAIVALVLLRRQKLVAGGLFLLVALVTGGLVAPSLRGYQVILGPSSLIQKSGLWFSQTIQGIELAGVERIEVVQRPGSGGTLWSVFYIDQRKVELEPGDLLQRNAETILKSLKTRGIVVQRK